MANNVYKNAEIFNDAFYRVPGFISKDFSDIPGKEFLVQEGDRLDIIAEQLYGNPNYWREIAIYNNIGYFFDIKPGMTIKVPLDPTQITSRL